MATDALTILFACDSCRQSFEVPVVYAGRSAVCKGCGKKLTIPLQSTRAPSRHQPEIKLDDRGHVIGSDGKDSPDFEYGSDGTIYYAGPPRESDLGEEEELALEDPGGALAQRKNSKEGLLDFASNMPAAGGAPDAPLHMLQADLLLRRALAKHLEAKQAIAAERERGNQQQQLIELEKQEKLRQQRAVQARRTRLRKWRLRGLALVCIAYGVCAYLGLIGDWIVLSPTREAILVPLERPRQIPMANGNVLEMWTTRSSGMGNEEPEAYVLALCGNDQRAETAASMALDRFIGHKVEVWSPNYPGFGGSSGRASLDSMLPAASVAFYVLHNTVARGKPIFLTGQNIGADLALSMAVDHRDIAGLVLYDPAPLKDLMLGRYGWFNLWIVGGAIAWFAPPDFNAVELARRVRVPAVFIIAGSDSLVPISYQQEIIDAYAGDHRTVSAPSQGHDALSTGPTSPDPTNWLFQTLESNRKLHAAVQPVTRPAHSSATRPETKPVQPVAP